MFKIACYGVRHNEVEYFNKLNKYNYDLTLIPDLLRHDNVSTAEHHDAVLLRGNSVADKQNLDALHSYGIKYVFTRTVGFNHIDVEYARSLGIRMARVPSYSPTAIAELSVTLAMMLLRKTAYMTVKSAYRDFIIDDEMFTREIHNCTVGIIGLGKIGLAEAKLFHGLGARVIGYDIFESEKAKEFVEFMTLDELLPQSDIISLHVPYVPGQNEKFVNAEFIGKMKQDAILVNTARGEIQDNEAVLAALESKKLSGFATDVFSNEAEFFQRKFMPWQTVPDSTVQKLIELFPRVLVTPHVGSNTEEALSNMVETSYENFHEMLTRGACINEICP